MSSNSLVFSAVLLAASLAGCAGSPPSAQGQASAEVAASAQVDAAAGTPPAAAPAAAVAAPEPRRLPADGTVAEFQPQDSRLSEEALALLADVAPTLVQAQHIEITGFCNRQDAPKNARQVALTRAMAVRGELLRLGVPAKGIRVKYVTTEARHAVTVVQK
ncbi:MAG: OmpA family protein [Curvibacter sp.]|nr:OmpA family protein [Curvibacter sp.]